jgi:hypothetical protein
MRFSLAIISAAFLAQLAHAAPAIQDSPNMAIEASNFKSAQMLNLEMKDTFEPFHWQKVNNAPVVDRTFKLELKEPAELQITDLFKGKE